MLGRVTRSISKFLLGILDRYLAKEDRELSRQVTRQKILKLKIQNAENLLKLGSKLHLDKETKTQIVRRTLEIDEYFESHIIDQKITR